MKMQSFSSRSAIPVFRILPLAWLILGLCIVPAFAADISMEADLGDTINLHGVSFTGDKVYLFLTGPGLPANGVVLTDTSQRADQGQFTIVDLADDQTWSMKWDTSRIENEIDPGTYLVYVTNEPVDLSHLGGTDSYKTLEVFFQESKTQRVSVSSGPSYTLNPEKHSSVSPPALSFTSPTPTPAPAPTSLATPPSTLPTPLPTTKAMNCPYAALVAVLASALLLAGRTG